MLFWTFEDYFTDQQNFKTGIFLDVTNDIFILSGLFGTPEGSGKIPYLDKFDASFFGISPKAANFMDPRQRILTETCYEAIIDAGYNPEEIRGSKTGI